MRDGALFGEMNGSAGNGEMVAGAAAGGTGADDIAGTADADGTAGATCTLDSMRAIWVAGITGFFDLLSATTARADPRDFAAFFSTPLARKHH